MRGFALTATLVLALASQAGAQTGLSSIGIGRSGSPTRSGPGRATSPTAVRPAPAPPANRPATPDARLGAGGIRPNTGNVVYPGTPNSRGVGNILTPGTPAVQPIPSIVQPARPSIQEFGPPTGRHHRGARFAQTYFPIYGLYAYPFVPNVIAVTGSAITQSSSGYVLTVGGARGPEPAQPEPAQAGPEQSDPAYWLIALHGGLIYAVSDYTIEARALRFVTLQGDAYVVPLAELDIDFTTKLNRDRGVEINLDQQP